MSTTRLVRLGDVEICDETGYRGSTTGRSWTDVRPNCLRGKTVVTSLNVCMVPILIHSRRPTYACAHDRVPSRDRATEHTPESKQKLVEGVLALDLEQLGLM
eukprot:4062985-Pleurochrysis_carterae.AAC.1